jgi:TonB family protein
MTKPNLSAFFLMLFFACHASALAQAQDATDAVRKLEAEKKGIGWRVRHIVAESKIRYDAGGKLIGRTRPGRWSLNSIVEVERIELKEGILKIKGNWFLLNYSRSIRRFRPVRTSDAVEIQIQTKPGPDGKVNLLTEWEKAFLTVDENLPEGIQPYWKPFLECVVTPDTNECRYFEQKSMELDVYEVKPVYSWKPVYPDVYQVGGDVMPPQSRSRTEPEYTQVARKNGIEGTVLLHAIVTKEGKMQILRIVRPLGYGLEESAAEALSRWTFQPGTLKGQPVSVSLFIEVSFNLKD